MSLSFKPKKIIVFLIIIFLLLLVGNFFSIYLKYFTDLERFETVRKITDLFNFDKEQNLPTLFSSLILLLSAFLLHYLALLNKKEGKNHKNWLILAFVFYFLSVDEAVSLHELLIHPVRRLLDADGFLFWAWVIPYGIAVLAFFIYNLKFLKTLPAAPVQKFIFAGFVFVLGAIGMEMWGGYVFSANNGLTFSYSLIATLEETLEMVGIIYFIHGILEYTELSHEGIFAKFYIYSNREKALRHAN